MSTKFSKKFEKFSNAENYFQNRRKSTLFRALSSAFGGMKNCRPSGNSVSRQKFFIFLQRCYASTSCTLPRPSLRMERALRSGRWDSFSAEKPRRLQRATGTLPRAAFRIPPSGKTKRPSFRTVLSSGGEGGIRTHVACYRQLDFEFYGLMAVW